jgi:hypothetical protein
MSTGEQEGFAEPMKNAGEELEIVIGILLGGMATTVPTVILYLMVTWLFLIPLVLGSLSVLLGLVALRTESPLRRHAFPIQMILVLVSIFLPIVVLNH